MVYCARLSSTEMEPWEKHLEQWETAGVVDGATGERIRAFEAGQVNPARQRWQVVVALIFGGILLGAGVLLFVAAHWDEVSPTGRFLLVVGVLAALHVGAVLSGERFPAMATVLHAVGTIGAGAAIALVGQIFNMQEHWPAAILLWGAVRGGRVEVSGRSVSAGVLFAAGAGVDHFGVVLLGE